MRGTLTEECLARCLDKKHPLVCGEHTLHYTRRTNPTYAGNTKISVGQPVYVRLNPAYARRTYGLLKIPPPTEKHPHVCGEDASLGCSDIADPETPTTMQGAPSVATMMDPNCGITPAYAGNTFPYSTQGEGFRITPSLAGSTNCCSFGARGVYAGGTPFQYCRRCDCPAHPRVCGEHAQFR